MIAATIKDKKQKHYDGAILAWVTTASLLSLLDLILLFILSHDYYIAEDQLDELSLIGVSKLLMTVFTLELMCYSIQLILSAIGIVMTLAARGFVLWVINVVFIVVLSKHIHRRYEKIQKQVST